MRTHNHLLNQVDGCDGFKTGYFKKAGFSIAATAKRGGVRIIAIVMGSKNRKVRDAKAIELIAKGFAMVPPQAEPAVQQAVSKTSAPATTAGAMNEKSSQAATMHEAELAKEKTTVTGAGWGKFFLGLGLGFALYAGLDFIISSKQRKRKWRIK